MNSGIGSGASGQRSVLGRAQTSSGGAGGTALLGQGEAEMSQFMQVVAQMTLQQAAMMGSSIVNNMQPDDGGAD